MAIIMGLTINTSHKGPAAVHGLSRLVNGVSKQAHHDEHEQTENNQPHACSIADFH